VELATGSAFRAGGCGHPPRDQLPHLSGLDLTTELLSEFVSPRFDHGIMGNPGDRTVGTIEGHRDLGRFYEQPVQFLLQHGRRPIHEPVPPGQIPLSKAPKPSHITKESGIPPLTISPLHRHAQKLTCTLRPAITGFSHCETPAELYYIRWSAGATPPIVEEARKGGNPQGIEGIMTRQSQDVEFLIITPTYHRESLLIRFLKQVKSQTYGCWRLLVV